MTSLLTKLQSAKEGSRELDAEIFNAFPDERWPFEAYRETDCAWLESAGRHPRFHDGWLTKRKGVERDAYPEELPHYTTSLDAIVSLIERVKPGACWRVEKLPPALAAAHGASHWASCGMPGEQEDACADGGALALCISLLRAMVE